VAVSWTAGLDHSVKVLDRDFFRVSAAKEINECWQNPWPMRLSLPTMNPEQTQVIGLDAVSNAHVDKLNNSGPLVGAKL